jgi:hypothetical protein
MVRGAPPRFVPVSRAAVARAFGPDDDAFAGVETATEDPMHTLETSLDGRRYVVDVHPAKRDEPLHLYVQVYRLRKDGSRGLHLMAHRPEAWAVWKTIRAQAITL